MVRVMVFQVVGHFWESPPWSNLYMAGANYRASRERDAFCFLRGVKFYASLARSCILLGTEPGIGNEECPETLASDTLVVYAMHDVLEAIASPPEPPSFIMVGGFSSRASPRVKRGVDGIRRERYQ